MPHAPTTPFANTPLTQYQAPVIIRSSTSLTTSNTPFRSSILHHIISTRLRRPESINLLRMPLLLQPRTENGIMLWTPTTILLHALWSWQFALSCAAEVLLLMAIATSYQNLWGAGREVPPIWAWVLFVVTALLAVLVIAEICLYANSNLSPNLYLGLQTGKLAYATLIFVLFLAFSNMPSTEGVWNLFLEIVEILVFYPPWVLTFVLAVLIKLTERRPAKEELTGSQSAENSPERAPLLPTHIPSPKLPSQRLAVQRYPS